jgi:hypothetical protein
MARLYRHKGSQAVLAMLLVTAVAVQAQPLLSETAPTAPGPHASLQVAQPPADAPSEPVSSALDLEWGPAFGLALLSTPPVTRRAITRQRRQARSGFPDQPERPPRSLS